MSWVCGKCGSDDLVYDASYICHVDINEETGECFVGSIREGCGADLFCCGCNGVIEEDSLVKKEEEE